MSIYGILENLIADIIFILIAAFIGWAIYHRTKHSKLLAFFGVRESRRIVVYLSNLRVVSGGAIGIDGEERSYEGSATVFREMRIANRFRDLFNYFLPSIAEKSDLLSKLLISDVRVDLLNSPEDVARLEYTTSMISIGGPAYNIASSYVESLNETLVTSRLGKRAQFSTQQTYTDQSHLEGDTGYAFDRQTSEMENIPSQIIVKDVPPITDALYGFVQRIYDRDRKRSIFYCAGMSELGTVGAANYLVTEWMRLYKKYNYHVSFLVMLRFESTDFTRWTIVFERS